VPPKCKFFSWLAIQNRIWTTDRLVAKNWHHAPTCVLCALESGIHLFVECRFTSRERSTMLSGCNRKGLRSLLILVIWSIWRNQMQESLITYSRVASKTLQKLNVRRQPRSWQEPEYQTLDKSLILLS
jgi:hypothetical protein